MTFDIWAAFLLHRQGEDAPPARVMVFAQSEEQARRILAANSNSQLAHLAGCTHVAAAHAFPLLLLDWPFIGRRLTALLLYQAAALAEPLRNVLWGEHKISVLLPGGQEPIKARMGPISIVFC